MVCTGPAKVLQNYITSTICQTVSMPQAMYRNKEIRSKMKVTTRAKSRALSLQTQWDILSGPDAIFLILEKASITFVSLSRGDRCFSLSISWKEGSV